MKRIRLGNTIDIVWEIFLGKDKDKGKYDLTGKKLTIYLVSAFDRIKISDFTTEFNVLRFTFEGKDQKHQGRYQLTFVENEGGDDTRTLNKCDAFELVKGSCMETDDLSEITLASSFDALRIYPIIPQVGPNRNWWVDGVDTGKSSVGLTAYEFAKEQGYEGTEEEYAAECLAVPVLNEESREATEAATKAAEAATIAAKSATDAAESANNASAEASTNASQAAVAAASANEAAEKANEAAGKAEEAIEAFGSAIANKADKIKFEGKSYVETDGISTDDFYYSMPDSADGTEDDIIATKSYLKKINGQDLYGKGNIVIEGAHNIGSIDLFEQIIAQKQNHDLTLEDKEAILNGKVITASTGKGAVPTISINSMGGDGVVLIFHFNERIYEMFVMWDSDRVYINGVFSFTKETKLYADSELSETSENAVQNKVVTEKLEETASAIARNTAQITQVSGDVGEMSGKLTQLSGEIDRHYTFATNGNYENITAKIGFLKKGATIVNRGVAFIAYKDSARTESLTIRTGDTIVVDTDKSFMIAGSTGGTIDFDYKVSEALLNTEALQKELANKIQVYDKNIGVISFDAKDYVQGYYNSGSGLVASDFVISSQAYEVNKGDVINVFPNGETIQLFILDTDGINFTTLKSFSNVTEVLTYKSEYRGYLRVVSRAGGQIIRPNSAKVLCSIRKAAEDEQGEVSNGIGIYKSVLDKIPVQIVNDSQNGTKMQFSNASTIDVDGELYPKVVRVTNGYVRYLNPVDMKNNHLAVRLRINRLDNGGYINVKVGNTAFPSKAFYYELARTHVNTIIGVWQEFTIPCLAYQTPTTNINFDDINDIFIIVNNGEIDVQYIGIKSNPLKKGIVTFTFDDGYTTQMDAAKMMCRKGVQGTYYVIKKAIDDNAEGYLTIPQLQQMAEQFNSDIQVHGNSPFDNETDESLLTIFRETQAMLKDNGISDGDHMSYPNGYHSERVVRLARKFFKSCRTILQNIPIETYPPYDRYRMRSVSAIVDSQVDKVKEYIDRCVENNTWLILTFHKMEAAPSGASDPSMYCSMAAFEEILNYAVEKANVMSMAEVMRTSYVVE